ncbi:hypothetical protein [Agrococcus sp. BE272]|uniref:hypothetical protein n=1 Tax=Agrococcus sp. BE272 TaxID=2817727 RepID=UPI00285E4331|nr:hypothetical protein [Agrococcus sp. BE272]MDR7233136.1 hypothetical protein [Agrococcus sp. BE272]
MAVVGRSRARALRCLAAAAALVALSGCLPAGGGPDRTDPGATASPAEPIGHMPGPSARCHDDVFWGGPEDKVDEVPADAQYRGGFDLPGALDRFDVLCASSWTMLTNDCRMRFARAYLDGGDDGARLDEIDQALVAWATERGMEQTRISMSDNTHSYGISVHPDGALTTLLQWDAVSRHEGADGVQMHADMAGIPLDGGDVVVSWQVCPALQGWETPPAP